jgi:cytochrome P450
MQLPVGAFLRLALASAIRDRGQFASPDALDLGREPNHHVAFGFGQHACAGAKLARLGIECALASILRRYEMIALEPGGAVRDLRSVFRGFRQLQIRVTSRSERSGS